MARLPLSYRLKQVDVADLDSMGSRIEHADALNALEEAIVLVTAAEALRDAHLAHIRASGRIPELQDARNCAFESLLVLLPEEPHD